MLHVSSNIGCDYCVTCVSLFINLRHPRDFTSHTSRRGGEPSRMYKCLFFCTSAFFSLPAAGLFSCSRLQSKKGARPNTTTKVWALAEVCPRFSSPFRRSPSSPSFFRFVFSSCRFSVCFLYRLLRFPSRFPAFLGSGFCYSVVSSRCYTPPRYLRA